VTPRRGSIASRRSSGAGGGVRRSSIFNFREEEPRKFVDFMNFTGELHFLPRKYSILLREPEEDDDLALLQQEHKVEPESLRSTRELVEEKLSKLIKEGLRNNRKSPKKEQKMNIIKEKVAIRVPGAKEGKHEEIRTRNDTEGIRIKGSRKKAASAAKACSV